MIVVLDSGPVIHLSWIGHLRLLPAMFNELLMPPAVRGEVLRSRSDTRGLEEIRSMLAQGVLRVQQPSPPRHPALSLPPSLGPGETEAIHLAEQVVADLFISDDTAARTAARRRGLTVTGTIGLLKAARQDGLIPAVLPLALELRRLGQWLSDSLIAEIEDEESSR
jgi:uncharacterized protein